MRFLIGAVLISLLSGPAASADDVFGDWMIFPGPNPDAANLLPHADPDRVFRIGQIIFEYPYDRPAKDDQPVKDLSQLQSVADVVKVAVPGPALAAIVDQQLTIPHGFHFESATVADQGDGGLEWTVTFVLFPRMGGSTGVPFRYRAVLDGSGNLVSPRLTIFDAFFHSAKEGWTCSVLQLPAGPTPKDAALTPEEVRNRATANLLDANGLEDVAKAAKTRMEYQGQEKIRIPVSTDATAKLTYVQVWAVNFRDPSRKERSDELFTVWVTRDGRVADIQYLEHWWGFDELTEEREPE